MVARWLVFFSGALLPCFSVAGCQSAKAAKAEIVTEIEMVRPASERPAFAASAVASADRDPVDELAEFCRQVERQAGDTNAGLPKRLDQDTSATRVVAYGCDVVLEYAMLDLTLDQVGEHAMSDLRKDVLQKLCADPGARGVLEHGGSFTNVYRDKRSVLIDQFTIAREECPDQSSAQRTPALVNL